VCSEAREEGANVKAELAPLREWTVSQAQAIRERMRTSLLELDAVMAEGSDQEPVIVVSEAQEDQPGEGREDHAVHRETAQACDRACSYRDHLVSRAGDAPWLGISDHRDVAGLPQGASGIASTVGSH
jgi:hypothetical protein